MLGDAGKPGDLLHRECAALDVLGIALGEAQGRELHAVIQHRHREGVVGGIAAKLVLQLLPGGRLGVGVHLQHPGKPGPVLVEFPLIPLRHGVHGDGLPGQLQQAAPLNAVVGLEVEEGQLIGGKGALPAVHVVVVPVMPALQVLADGAALRGQGDAGHQAASSVPPVPAGPEAVPEGVGHDELLAQKWGHALVGPHLQQPVQRRVVHRPPGVPVLDIGAEGDQPEGVAEDAVGSRHRGEPLRGSLARLHVLPGQEQIFEEPSQLLLGERPRLHRRPGAIDCPVKDHRPPPLRALAMTTA